MSLPDRLQHIFETHNSPEQVFAELLPALGQVLGCDRCFLHLRNPHTRMHRNLCWRRSPDLPDVSTAGWQPEAHWEDEDPMFAAALRAEPSIFVEDIETADPAVLNLEFERKSMGHRALVHAHIVQDGLLWGILQPAVYGQPRVWSAFDRDVIVQVLERLKPLIIANHASLSGPVSKDKDG